LARVVVTGGAGYIGSHAVRALADAAWSTSLSPLPLRHKTTVFPASDDRSRQIHARAWDGSRAGMIPSVRDNRSIASSASSSVADS